MNDCQDQQIFTIPAKSKQGRLVVQCPLCKHWQPIIIGFDLSMHDYRALPDSNQGHLLYPDFVCTSKNRKCDFMGKVRLILKLGD